jgi:ADP-ribose pyrophosphatase
MKHFQNYTMTIKPWKILESHHLHKNVRIDTCELPNGKVIDGFVLEYGDWATIVALTKKQEVVMVRQYRHGAQKVILELPGGAMDAEDENPLSAARRELLEETGYTSDTFIQIGCVSPNPANQTNLIYSFLALDADKVSSQNLDETEEIEVVLKPFEEVIAMAKSSELIQSMQVSAIFFALAYLDRIV